MDPYRVFVNDVRASDLLADDRYSGYADVDADSPEHAIETAIRGRHYSCWPPPKFVAFLKVDRHLWPDKDGRLPAAAEAILAYRHRGT